jgi:ubiquinol oxidase
MIKTLTTSQIIKTAASASVVSRIMLPATTTTLARRAFSTNQPHYQVSSNEKISDVVGNMPRDIYREVLASKPMPMCEEFIEGQQLTTEALEKLSFGPGKHYEPRTLGDKVAFRLVKILRTLPDTYFGRDHYMRAVMLETIAAVPGMVAAMLRHMKSLRTMTPDNGWISHLLHEAENERFHLMVWLKCIKPSTFNRLLILGAQGVFFNTYFLLYMLSSRSCHRFCGYLEEEAVISYTHFLNDLDAGLIKNEPAPQFAIDYYNLSPSATVRDVVLAVRADEAVHRDANHFFSDRIAMHKENILAEVEAEHQRELKQGQGHHGSTSSFA